MKKIFEDRAKKNSAPIHWAENEFNLESFYCEDGYAFTVCEDSIKTYNPIPCALEGTYQKENAGTVLSLIETLREIGYIINDNSVYQGFKNVVTNTDLRGRWEKISENPRIICDTGHNEAGFRFVTKQLAQTPHETLHFVIGMVSDKDVNSVLRLLPKDAIYYYTKAQIPRALDEKILAEFANGYGLKGSTYPTVALAMEAAKKNCRPNDLIFVGGSNFIVAEVI